MRRFLIVNTVLFIVPTYVLEILIYFIKQNPIASLQVIICFSICFPLLYEEFINIFTFYTTRLKSYNLFTSLSKVFGKTFPGLLFILYFFISDYNVMLGQAIQEICYFFDWTPYAIETLPGETEDDEGGDFRVLSYLSIYSLSSIFIRVNLYFYFFPRLLPSVLQVSAYFNFFGLITMLLCLLSQINVEEIKNTIFYSDYNQNLFSDNKDIISIRSQFFLYYLGFETVFLLMPTMKLKLTQVIPAFRILKYVLPALYTAIYVLAISVRFQPITEKTNPALIVVKVLKLSFPYFIRVYTFLLVMRIIEIFLLYNRTQIESMNIVLSMFIKNRAISLFFSTLIATFYLIWGTRIKIQVLIEIASSFYSIFFLFILYSIRDRMRDYHFSYPYQKIISPLVTTFLVFTQEKETSHYAMYLILVIFMLLFFLEKFNVKYGAVKIFLKIFFLYFVANISENFFVILFYYVLSEIYTYKKLFKKLQLRYLSK